MSPAPGAPPPQLHRREHRRRRAAFARLEPQRHTLSGAAAGGIDAAGAGDQALPPPLAGLIRACRLPGSRAKRADGLLCGCS